jgi:hypothetical protein
MAIPKAVGKRYKESLNKKKAEPVDKDKALVDRWLKEISTVQQNRRQQSFENIGQRILDKFRNKSDVDTVGTDRWYSNVMFNVLWSNVQVLEPALYSRMPKVVIERTFKDSDPIARLACEGAERATSYNLMQQQDKFNYMMSAVVQDRLLPGRGISRLQYKAEFQPAFDVYDEEDDVGGENEPKPLLDAEGHQIMEPKPYTESVDVCMVNWLDYLESLSRNQFEVRWRAFRIYKTRAELLQDPQIDPECAKAVRLGSDAGRQKRFSNYDNQDDQEFARQASIWVIEDETTKKVYWISEGYKDKPLKVLDDPFKIKGFFSCPLPLTATTTTESTYPTADYVIYQGLADELNYTAGRIKSIVNCIRLVGAHAASFNKEMKNITDLPDGQTWPIQAWGQFVEGKGFKGMLDWVPFDNCVAALPALQEYQISLKAQIDEITSMPDIVRGSSDPNDPIYTQQQKSHWTVIKLVRKQQEVQRYCRQLISKMAQMIFEPGFFSDETIYLMAGVGQMTPEKQQMWPQALQLLRDDRLNSFRIDIETDSTIAIDEADAASRWGEYLKNMQAVIGSVTNETPPEFVTPIIEASLAYVRTLRTGRSVEGQLEKSLETWEQKIKQAQENPQPPPPDPLMIRAETEQQKVQIQAQKDQAEFQLKQQELGMKGQEMQFNQYLEQQKLQQTSQKNQGDFMLGSQKNQIDAGEQLTREQIDKLIADADVFQAQLKNELEKIKVMTKADIDKQRLELDKKVALLDAQESVIKMRGEEQNRQLEHKRIMIDHHHNMKALEHDLKVTKETAKQAKEAASKEKEKPEKKEKQSPIVINNIIPKSSGKNISIKPNKDGGFEGSSSEAE